MFNALLAGSNVTPLPHPCGMGYRGKLAEQERARTLRAEGWTMPEIASHLGVSKGSVSLWTR